MAKRFETQQGFLPLFDPPAPAPVPPPAARAKDPPTSHEAAEGAKDFAPTHHEKILEALRLGPASKTELWRRTGIDSVAVARRAGELVDRGEIVVVSNDGRSLTGKRERVYGLPGGAAWQGLCHDLSMSAHPFDVEDVLGRGRSLLAEKRISPEQFDDIRDRAAAMTEMFKAVESIRPAFGLTGHQGRDVQ